MDRDAIVSQVIDITARSDKQAFMVAMLDLVCNSIASRIHAADSLVEGTVPLTPNSSVHNFNLPDNYLRVAYIRPAPHNNLLSPISPNRAFKAGNELVNVYYQSGNQLIIKLASTLIVDSLLIGYYAKPPTLELGNSSNWVTLRYPELVITLLAARVFMAIGDFDSGKAQQQASALLMEELIEQQTLAGDVSILGGR